MDSNNIRTIVEEVLQRLAEYMEKNERFGAFWRLIFDEYQLTREMVLKVSGQQVLLEDNPRARLSIQLRETVVLPLLVIQQAALMRCHALRPAGDEEQLELFEHKPELAKLHGKACPKKYLEGRRFAFIRGVPTMMKPNRMTPLMPAKPKVSGVEIIHTCTASSCP